ncbi:DUF664 domain-containing protein [Actinocrinis puniceicyclus]|uniref:DUF664 domain-containing protein n=1 Tax=Actinocrinis puniceicyclus TaxID=977794 RepID=A0A8J8B948_9ACTN|nr:DUF664 domain-containing protein [Actinocrinis puniceicyclus]MBS2961447.1 DUF664 domain-containing protein [Actinocrinis puniceicyclus]
MNGAQLIVDAFGRVQEVVHRAAEGLTAQQLAHRLDPDANSIGWLLWHLTRVQDDHVAHALDVEQAWTAQGWHERFDLPFKPNAIGYGHKSEDVAAVRIESAQLLTGYYDAVYAQTIEQVRGLADRDFDRIVDESWDPPVSLGVRLVSVVSDTLQHAGQAAFIRGVLERRP